MRAWGCVGFLVLASCSGNTAGSGGDAGLDSGGAGGLPGTGGAPGTGAVPSTGGLPGTGGSNGCVAHPSTQYFLALGLSLEPKKPVVAVVSVAADDSSGLPVSSWSVQPLSWKDRQTPVGSAIALPPIQHDSTGAFSADPPTIDVPGEANPFSHTLITVDLKSLAGAFCPGQTFACGTVGGLVVKPIEVPVDGSTWTLTKLAGDPFPEPPPVDCALTPALPVGTFQ